MSLRTQDAVNRHLISLLQANAREPLASLARKVGLSRNAVSERLRRLERDGVIAGYTVRLGDVAAAAPVRAYVMVYLDGVAAERVVPGIARLPEVKMSQSLSGEFDIILYVEAEAMEDLTRVRDELVDIHGVRKVSTAVVLRDRFDRR